MNLVTGGTGHIGNVLIRELLMRGEKVRALILPGEDRQPVKGLEVEIIEGDILDRSSLQRAFQGVRVVYHLAGVISITDGYSSLVERVNVQGTMNVLQVAQEVGVKRLVYTSSIHAIRRAPHGITIDETIPFDPAHASGLYDRTKAEASLAVLQAARQGLDAVIVCPTGVIGPYDFRGSEMGSLILDYMKPAPHLSIDGAYDFVDVRDVARGHILACDKGRPGECYILSGERITLTEIEMAVQQATGNRSLSVKVPFGLARLAAYFSPLFYRLTKIKPRLTRYALEALTSNSRISHSKARLELGYAPRPLRASIADTVAWFLQNSQPWTTARIPIRRK